MVVSVRESQRRPNQQHGCESMVAAALRATRPWLWAGSLAPRALWGAGGRAGLSGRQAPRRAAARRSQSQSQASRRRGGEASRPARPARTASTARHTAQQHQSAHRLQHQHTRLRRGGARAAGAGMCGCRRARARRQEPDTRHYSCAADPSRRVRRSLALHVASGCAACWLATAARRAGGRRRGIIVVAASGRPPKGPSAGESGAARCAAVAWRWVRTATATATTTATGAQTDSRPHSEAALRRWHSLLALLPCGGSRCQTPRSRCARHAVNHRGPGLRLTRLAAPQSAHPHRGRYYEFMYCTAYRAVQALARTPVRHSMAASHAHPSCKYSYQRPSRRPRWARARITHRLAAAAHRGGQ